MMDEKRDLTTADLDALTRKWWEAPVSDATGQPGWDEEIKAINAASARIATFPRWVLEVRETMPKWGFEMCAHRWLDGLDEVLRMIETGRSWPSTLGHCGDVPGRIFSAVERRAAALQAWGERQVPAKDCFRRQVAYWLGEPTPAKREAAECLAELMRAFFFATEGEDTAKERAKAWRGRASANELLALLFEGEGLDALLENRCGFKTLDRLDLYIRIIGGDLSQAAERHGLCNRQLRFVLRDDPARYEVTRGYLWGLQAYLLGHDAAWLRSAQPECAGAAIYALRRASAGGEPTLLRRWLVASLLKAAKIWCQRALAPSGDGVKPAYTEELPDVASAIGQ